MQNKVGGDIDTPSHTAIRTQRHRLPQVKKVQATVVIDKASPVGSPQSQRLMPYNRLKPSHFGISHISMHLPLCSSPLAEAERARSTINAALIDHLQTRPCSSIPTFIPWLRMQLAVKFSRRQRLTPGFLNLANQPAAEQLFHHSGDFKSQSAFIVFLALPFSGFE